jgi:ferritin-like metal-binding protein YciE
MQLNGLQQLFVHELKDIYSAEHQILKALPKMIKAASNDDLSTALEEHRQITEEQVRRLETVLGEIGKSGNGQKCKGMEGLLEEGEDLLKEEGLPEVLDAGIIGAAQKVEHYEIAAYGTLVSFARRLGYEEAALLLEQSLAEEKEADQKLTEIAESSVNEIAA